MDRKLALFAITAAVPGCPYTPAVAIDTDITTHEDSGSSSDTDPTDSDPTTEPTDPSAPSTTNPSDPDSTGTDSGDAVCGDGEVQGDEVCDDMVNDGAYGGCAADCSAFAERCGDETVNGPEICDDGVNDGGYGGCSVDCSALGPYCGDTEVNGPEGCDLGDGNVNGMGCNADCVVSGTLLGSYDLGGLDFCDNVFVTEPAFRDNGTVVVAATGYCEDDTTALVELNDDVTESQVFDLLLPQTPVREATALGDDWILSASGCNYVISDAGVLTEVCGDRIAGYNGLEAAADNGSYVALEYDAVALFPATSPMAGDSPTWVANAANDVNNGYSFNAVTYGASGSVAVAGSHTYTGSSTYGYVARYTSSGNLVAEYQNGDITPFYDLVHAPDGTVVAIGSYPSYDAVWLNSTYSDGAVIDTGSDSDVVIAFDSTSALVMITYSSASSAYEISKRTADGTVLWSHPIASLNYQYRIAIDDNDAIWVADAVYGGDSTEHLVVQKFAP